MLTVGFFACLGVVCFITLSMTLWSQPLTAWDVRSIDWLQSWLWMTVLDYYGACLPLCAVIVQNEPALLHGCLWSLACCLGGSPFCCLWVVLRLLSDRPQPYRYP